MYYLLFKFELNMVKEILNHLMFFLEAFVHDDIVVLFCFDGKQMEVMNGMQCN